MKLLMRATIIAVAVFATFYAIYAFVAWDIYWLKSMSDWKPQDRGAFVLFMIFVPLWLGAGAFVFRPLKRS